MPARHVVFARLSRPRQDADDRVHGDGQEHEPVADVDVRNAHLFQDREHDHETEEASGIDAVDAAEVRNEVAAARGLGCL